MNVRKTVYQFAIAGIVLSGMLVASFAEHPATSAIAVSTKKENKTPEKTILFFMNPNGHPCQMQKAILDDIADSLRGLSRITFIKTTEQVDLEKFDTWGIRGLPSLIIVDKNGKEIKRFAPGIQDAGTILAALRGKIK